MKELKKRIKGLSAILLAVSLALCLVVRFSGVRASAAQLYGVGNDKKISQKTIPECQGMIFSEIGDGIFRSSSGGSFALGDGNLEAFEKYMFFSEEGIADDGNTKYYTQATVINDIFPSEYEAIKISKSEPVTNDDGTRVQVFGGDLYKLTFAWVPKTTTISIGQTVSLTTGTQYSFPSGSTHKVQGDPTVYYGTSFYVSSSGTYTIEQ